MQPPGPGSATAGASPTNGLLDRGPRERVPGAGPGRRFHRKDQQRRPAGRHVPEVQAQRSPSLVSSSDRPRLRGGPTTGRPGPPFVWGSSFTSASLSVSTISMWLLAAGEEMSEAGKGHREQAAQHPSLHPLIGPQIGDTSPRPTFLTELGGGGHVLTSRNCPGFPSPPR